jgi:hypothetical protein
MSHCYLCNEENIDIKRVESKPVFEVICSACGKYSITDALKSAGLNDDQKKAAIWYLELHPGFEFTGESINFVEQEYRISLQLK